MIPLQPDTLERIRILYSEEQQKKVVDLLTSECAKGISPGDPNELERIRIAVLKISEGDLNEFLTAIEHSQVDCRDVLVSARFANDVNAHKKWFPKRKKS